ncbi:MAG TPA: O-antigen ligase family protein [Acetobacteraceae bacterium]|nr:O-antigen ligase family protein [Acetobacteraceae bacterium]
MSTAILTDAQSRILPALDRAALIAVLLTPLLLLHAHGFAEAAIAVTDACFLTRSAIARDWTWLRASWLRVGLLWWGWLVLCSLPVPALGLGEGGAGSLVQAVAALRFLIFVTALEHEVLSDASARRWLFGIIAAAAVYIALQVLVQFAFGHNLYGEPSGRDGELTGPFGKPRAGPPLSRILFPALIPPAAALLARIGVAAKLGAYALLLAGVCVMVLIGQRMPLLLTGLGLFVSAVLLRQLRPLVLVAGVAGAVLLAATVVVSPPTYHRLVLKFSDQMDHFATSQYGELYARALEIGEQHPVTGRGFDGFRTGCAMPRYFRASFDGRQPEGGGAVICAQHPHNFYAQALDEGGFPGLILFAALAIAWLMPLGRGLWRNPQPLRVGLFASILIQVWPLASTSAFTSMPMGGWFFLLLGWGLAEARAAGGTG